MIETAFNIGDVVVSENTNFIGKVHRITVMTDNIIRYDVDFGTMADSFDNDDIHILKSINDIDIIPARLKHSLTSTCPHCNYENDSYNSLAPLPSHKEIIMIKCKGCGQKYKIYIQE